MEAFLDARIEALLADIAPGGTATAELKMPGPEPGVVALRASRLDGTATLVILEDVSELRRLQHIRTAFIDNLSHELRTPLSTVSLLAETLAREAEVNDIPPRMRDRIAKIEVETGHLVQMVNELLDLARIEGGSQLDMVDGVDIGRLAAELRRAAPAVRRAPGRDAAPWRSSPGCRVSAVTRRAWGRSSSTSSTTR